MKLFFSPQRRGDTLTITKTGEMLTINGESFDFSQLAEGAALPREAINCEFICGDVDRINGELVIPILLPHGANASEQARFPQPMTVTADGLIQLPE